MRGGIWLLVCLTLANPGRAHSAGCDLVVAAASDLSPLEGEIRQAVPGCSVRVSFASSGVLRQQILAGADFDLFLAADQPFAEGLGGEPVLYARGRLAVWSSRGLKLADLRNAGRIGMANPAHAPYGRAARQALERRGLWKELEGRVVFSENVRQAYQFARTGNVDIAFVPWAMVRGQGGELVPASWHDPILQTAVVPRGARNAAGGRKLLDWLISGAGQKVLRDHGFEGVR